MTSEVETNIVAVERIKEYGETPQVIYLKFILIIFLNLLHTYIFLGSALGCAIKFTTQRMAN